LSKEAERERERERERQRERKSILPRERIVLLSKEAGSQSNTSVANALRTVLGLRLGLY
jgi:hypothetical protein